MSDILRRRFMQAAAVPPSAPTFVTRIRESGARTGYFATGYTPPDLSSYAVNFGLEQTTSGFGGYVIWMYNANNDGRTSFAIGGASTTTWRQSLIRYDSNSNIVNNNQWMNRTQYPTGNFYMTPKRYGVGGAVSGTYTAGTRYPGTELYIGKNPGDTAASAYDGIYGTFYVFGTDAQDETSYAGLLTHTPIATFRPCIYNGIVTMWHVEQNRPCTVVDGTFLVYEN